jgi:Concanavalin A-like lectin/glucanases superfamily/Lamin Tail Domain/CotH kinase protein
MRHAITCLLLFNLALRCAPAADSVVVFNEIHYHPVTNEAANEWVELHNQMAIDIDLSAWSLTGDIGFAFGDGTIIPGGGYLVIASDPLALQAAASITNVLGPFIGRLNNSSGDIKLRDRNDRLMDEVTYGDGGKWPIAPDGSGATLAKRDPNSASGPPENWTASVLVGGTPGRGNFPETNAVQRRSLIAFNSLWRYEASGTDLGSAWRAPNFDDRTWAGQNNATLISYWPFDGNATATRGTSGTFVGAVTATTDRRDAAGGALAFSGASSYVEVSGGGGLNGATAGTISLWVKWSGTQDADCCGTFGAVLARQGNGLFSDDILALDAADPHTARVVWRQSGGPAPVLLTGTTVVSTNWHHVAVTFASTSSTLYVDGVGQGTGMGAGLHDNAGVQLSIGAWAGDGGGFATASLDEVAIWSQPLTAAQIAQLASQTKAPLDFATPESAVYFAGDGRLTSDDELRRTALPLGPTTYYFRNTFQFGDEPSRTELKLDLAVDDGAVIYLNGAEVYRQNMPDGTVDYATLAASAVGDASMVSGISLAATHLVAGTNVLAVEVHQAVPLDSGMVFGAGLSAFVTPPGPGPEAFDPGGLVFNEITAAGAVPFEIELINRSAKPLDTGEYIVQRSGASPDSEYLLPSQTVPAGGFFVLAQPVLGFGAAPGDKLFLFRPGKRAVADALEVHERPRARLPDGDGEWLTPSTVTLGASNSFVTHTEVVINEIMYHAPPAQPFRASPEQWVELFNRSSNAMDLTGWRLDEGIDFRFATNTLIPPGGYLVVAKDPAALLAELPGIPVVGPFTNALSHSGENIVLRDAADNPANSVHYYDDGRWPLAADAGGASLELRDPRADGNAGGAWAASLESGRSAWRTYSYRGIAAASPVGPDGQWHEFVMGLLGRGEVLLDDIMVIETPSTTPKNLIQNGTFDTQGTNHWRIIGNHHGEVIEDPDQPGHKVLRLVATGGTDHMSNHAETTFVGNRDVVNGLEYLISFRAKWISGSWQFHTRLYFNRLARTTQLDAPTLHGTPGTRNSTFTTNIGPTYYDFGHEPAVPAPFVPVSVSVRAADPDGVAAMTLWWRVDTNAWNSVSMVPDASTPHRFNATVPGKAAGTIIQFYVQGIDVRGATSVFPAAGPDSRALYKVDDGLAATNGLHNLRLIVRSDDADRMHNNINVMSNDRTSCTVIYNEHEVFYNVGVRLKGSEHSRTTSSRLGFDVDLDSDHLFRGIHRGLGIDRSESTGFGQREMLNLQTLNHAGGVPTRYDDLIQVITPRLEHTGSADLQLASYGKVFLDDQFKNGGDGTVFEYELVYQLNPLTDDGTPEGNKVPAPDSVMGTAIRNLGDDKEGYRWTMLIKNNEDRDDYSRIIPFCKAMELTDANFTAQITNYIEVDQWLRGVAVNDLFGVGDNYGGDGSQHNVRFYVRPSDGRVIYFPYDMDAFFDANRSIVPNGDLRKLITIPAFARAYYGDLLDIIATTYNTSYLAHWANQFGRLLPAQDFAGHLSFIGTRGGVVTAAVNAAVPNVAFAIITGGGNNFATSNNVVTISGNAPLSVKDIEINGVRYPITWNSVTAWSVQIPLYAGTNLLAVQGLDRAGQRPTNSLDTITVTNTGPSALLPVAINEWMADNAGPGGFPDPLTGAYSDWFELYNPNSVASDLSGFYLSDSLAAPTKWQVPAGTVIPPFGFRLVWADNQTNLNAVSTNGDLHANFQLSKKGETIALSAPDGSPQHTVTFGPQYQNVSQGLFLDGSTNGWYFMTNWTPHASNQLGMPPAPQIGGVIMATNGTISIWAPALSSRAYRVDFKDDLATPAWASLATSRAVNGFITVNDNTTGKAQRFYRTVLLP